MAKRSDFAEEMGADYAKLGANLNKVRGKGAVGATVEEAEKLVKSTRKAGQKLSEDEERAKTKRMAMLRSGKTQNKKCGGKVKMAAGGNTRDPDRLNPGDVNKGGTKSRTKLAGKPLQYKKGGQVCRGMGAAKRGGNYKEC